MYGPIEIRNSCVVLHNYTLGDNEFLERMFTYYKKEYGRMKPYFMAIKYDAIKKDLYIPGGVDLYNVVRSFGTGNVIGRIAPDNYEMIGKVLLKKGPRDDRQKKAIRFCLGLEEYSNNRNASQISLNLSTGVGKTYVMVFVFAYYSVKTIMITSTNDWLIQWKEKILEYTNLKEEEIYIISETPTITKLTSGIVNHNKIKFYLCTHSTIYNYGKNNGWKKVRKLFQFLNIGIKVFDEAHLNFDNICKIDFAVNCWKNYYLTATPLKSHKDQDKIYQIAFKTIPKISLFDSKNDPHTAYRAVLFNSHPRTIDVDECYDHNHGFMIMKYVDYFSSKPIYYKMLKILLSRILPTLAPGEKILIYIGKNDAVIKTYYWIRYVFFNYSCGIYTSITPKNLKHEQLEKTIILTTTKSASAALDIQGLKVSIIFAEPFNSFVYARQILGRTRDVNTELFELVDVGFQQIRGWYQNKRSNIYCKYATECTEMVLGDYQIQMNLEEIRRNEMLLIDQIHERMKSHQHIVEIDESVKNKNI